MGKNPQCWGFGSVRLFELFPKCWFYFDSIPTSYDAVVTNAAVERQSNRVESKSNRSCNHRIYTHSVFVFIQYHYRTQCVWCRTLARMTDVMTYIRRNVLHWLDVTDRVRFRVCVQVFKCLHGMAPDYLSTMCHPVSRLPGRQNLRSANRGQLDVPRVTPSLWNTLPVHLKNRNPTLTTFMRRLKSYLFSQY